MDFMKICTTMCIAALAPSLNGDAVVWKFATSRNLTNVRLMSYDGSINIATLTYSKSSPEFGAKISCATICISNSICQAFNFYADAAYYSCEVLASNFCNNSTQQLALIVLSGGLIYEKLPSSAISSCIEHKYGQVPADQLCHTFRPGCTGTWPHCTSCLQTCLDCVTFYNKTKSYFDCTVYPSGLFAQPVSVRCHGNKTFLMGRELSLSNGKLNYELLLSFETMNDLISLNVYPYLEIYFETDKGDIYVAHYANAYIDANGTLSNLTFVSSTPIDNWDGFGLNGQKLAPTPFVWVANDSLASCGSFWLLNASSATNTCPGAGLGLFGKILLDSSSKVVDSGIHWPPLKGRLIKSGNIGLVNSFM